MNRTLIWQLAIRYLRGKRSANAVPILSRISMVAIAVSSAAMIIIFSVFDGMESLVKDTYKAFYPEIRITVVRGKFFPLDTNKLVAIRRINGIEEMSACIEDNAMAIDEANKGQKVVMVKGIDKNYLAVDDIRKYLVKGADSVSMGHPYTAIVGMHVLNELGLDFNYPFSKIELYYPNPAATNPEADPASAYQQLSLHPVGVFKVQDEFDSKYILAPLPLAQKLFRAEGKYSSIEIKAEPGSVALIKKQLQQLMGAEYRVESRYEQNRTLYVIMGAEKWAVYAILVLVLFIASFNMVGALTMLVIEKRKDIAILKAMGAQLSAIRTVFLSEGVLWSFMGGIAGIILGVIVCLVQIQFKLVPMRGDFLASSFPVEIQISDILLVIGTILVVGILAAWYPATRATKAVDPSLKAA
jgi:lipoprotein-releasing system permease protein